MTDSKAVIVALDFADAQQALTLAGQLDPEQCRLKVGKELFTRSGPVLVEALINLGFDVFLDLKFHDIPNTVARACQAAADLGVWMVNVHAAGGRRMMVAAREALASYAQPPQLIAVTVLTSLADEELAEIGFSGSAADNAVRLAGLVQQCGLDGVVCSSREVGAMRERFGPGFRLVTPGIRPSGSQADDQRRIMTPRQAIEAGADYLVIGRPITAAADPLAALQAIQTEVRDALSG
jgi:orotidine-5'-phosphate decarboxylase